MDATVTFRRRIMIAIAGFSVLAILMLLTTKRWESMITALLPASVIYRIFSNERHLALEVRQLATVAWPTRLFLFGPLPAFSLSVIVFWFPGYAPNMNVWGKYGLASFCLALLLVKVYERFLLARKRATATNTEKAQNHP